MKFKNPTSLTLKCEALGIKEIKPGAVVDIADHYCVPRSAVPGSPAAALPPVVRNRLPQLVPADESLLADWLANKLCVRPPEPPKPTMLDMADSGLPPGVAELALSGQAAQAPRPPHRNQAPAQKGR